MALSWIWITLIAFISTFLLQKLVWRKHKKRLPPGPKGLPILGHLHMVGKNTHQELHNLAKKYGPIMYLRFGLKPFIIVSSPEVAELFLKTHDLVFASRPPFQATKHLVWDQSNISFAPYGNYWRQIRKLITLELLSSSKISSFQSMRQEKLNLVVESLAMAAKENVVVDLSAKVTSLMEEMSYRMIFGKKHEVKDVDEKGFRSILREGMVMAVVPNLANYFPFLEILDLQGLKRKMKALAKVYDDFFEKILDAHGQGGEDGSKAVLDTMLSIMASGETEFQFDRRHVKAVMMDLMGGSIDTTSSIVDWTFLELLKNSRVMKKLQKELEDVVGLNKVIDESDLPKLEYLDMVIKEIFRLHPVLPLLLPHYSMEHCEINGYDIPKESQVIINVHAIGRDPIVWADPDKFLPERFMGSDIDVKGQHFQLMPFGVGRRGCPGIQLGLLQVQLIVAQLVHCFDWRLPNNMSPEDLDMTEEFGVVVSLANHLKVIPSLRLQI